jgi:hypothetical protein
LIAHLKKHTFDGTTSKDYMANADNPIITNSKNKTFQRVADHPDFFVRQGLFV